MKNIKTLAMAQYLKFPFPYYNSNSTYDSPFGMTLVGRVVITWPHTREPKPKNRHHIHWSRARPVVENASPPNWMITI